MIVDDSSASAGLGADSAIRYVHDRSGVFKVQHPRATKQRGPLCNRCWNAVPFLDAFSFLYDERVDRIPEQVDK